MQKIIRNTPATKVAVAPILVAAGAHPEVAEVVRLGRVEGRSLIVDHLQAAGGGVVVAPIAAEPAGVVKIRGVALRIAMHVEGETDFGLSRPDCPMLKSLSLRKTGASTASPNR